MIPSQSGTLKFTWEFCTLSFRTGGDTTTTTVLVFPVPSSVRSFLNANVREGVEDGNDKIQKKGKEER